MYKMMVLSLEDMERKLSCLSWIETWEPPVLLQRGDSWFLVTIAQKTDGRGTAIWAELVAR